MYLKFISTILFFNICSHCFGEEKLMSQINVQVKITAPIVKVGGHFPVEIIVTNLNAEKELVEVSQDPKVEFSFESKKYGAFVISKARYDNATYIYGDRPKPHFPQKALVTGESFTYQLDISRWYVQILPADQYQLIVHYTGVNGKQSSSLPIPVQIHGIINQNSNHTANIGVKLKVSDSINLAESFPIEITLSNQDPKNNADVESSGEEVFFEFELHSKDRGMFMISKAIHEGDSNPYKNSQSTFRIKTLTPGESITYKMDVAQWRKSHIPEGTYKLIVRYTAPDGNQYSSKPITINIS